MSGINIEPRQVGDIGGVLHKTIELTSEQKKLETPAKAVEVGKISQYDQIVDDARGVNEIYAEFDADTVQASMRGINHNLRRSVEGDLRKSKDGEWNIVFLAFTGETDLGRAELKWLVEFLDTHSDIIPVPLMPKLPRNATDDDQDEAPIDTIDYENYRKSIQRFLEEAEKVEPDAPIMGTLNVQFPWVCNRDVLDLYLKHDVKAFCSNFDKRTVTAKSQIEGFVNPLYETLSEQGISKRVLMYAINVGRKSSHDSKESPTARDFATIAYGFDILGENHEGLRRPPEVIEKIKEKFENEPTRIDVFDVNEYVYHPCTINEIDAYFPTDTALDLDRIKKKLRQRDEPPYSIRSLLNAEQMSLASRDVRRAIRRGDSRQHITRRAGITEDEIERMDSVRAAMSL